MTIICKVVHLLLEKVIQLLLYIIHPWLAVLFLVLIWERIQLMAQVTSTKCFQYLIAIWLCPLKTNTMKTLKHTIKLISFFLFPLCGMAQSPNFVADKTIPLTGNSGY